jgi:hypothetical protein
MRAPAMVEYKFKVGEIVFFHPKVSIDAPRGAYQIIRRLPASEGGFQYVIRSAYECGEGADGKNRERSERLPWVLAV